jgi:4-alpha-glucanotransferase
VRAALAARGVLSYKVRRFEDDPPSAWPALSVAAATTHDLPTIAGSGDSVEGVHKELLSAGSMVVLLTADDLVGATAQPNRPGTVDEWNWSRRLPLPVGDVATSFAMTLLS